MTERWTASRLIEVTPGGQRTDVTADVLALSDENARLRALYENVTGNRERFGWTINHLLECEESLRVAEEHARDADEASTQAAFWRARALELGASEDEYRNAYPLGGQ
jgi:hypothetical protein